MNSTKWPSLTEFAKFLGREGICRVVEEDDKGIHVAWIDNSPEALRRQDAIRKKERQDKGDEEREQMLIREQIRKARMEAGGKGEGELDEEEMGLKRQEGEKVKLNFGAKLTAAKAGEPKQHSTEPVVTATDSVESKDGTKKSPENDVAGPPEDSAAAPAPAPAPSKVSMKMGMSSKPKNVFAAAKKNALGSKKSFAIEQPKKMSEAERIMREEMERNSKRGASGFGGPSQKRQKY